MTDQNQSQSETQTLYGSCHCGAVKYEVQADPARGGMRCNCSVCTKIGSFNAIVKPDAFKLLAPEAELGTYEWGAKISTRYFCKACGTHCFGKGHLAEVGGDYVSFSYNSIDELELSELPVIYWDGRHNNWQSGPSDKPWPILKAPVAEPSDAA
jgi:hypothetical protein